MLELTEIQEAIALATLWRQERTESHLKGGVVIVYESTIVGWRDKLRNPEDFCPGCIAVSSSSEVWESFGGDCGMGAESWLKCNYEKLDSQE